MKIIGHRGTRGLAPENTLASLQKAVEHHVDELEFDLRVTRDGIVILHHDPYLTDFSGQRLVIADHNYSQLLAHKPDLATFEAVLSHFGHTVPLYIEVKPDEPIKPIVIIIKSHLRKGLRAEDLRLGSFSQETLLALQAELPEIEKIVIEKWSGVRATYRARQLGTKRITMNQRWLWWGFIKAMSHDGYHLGAYTLNNPVKARRWAKYGLEAVITDYPGRFK